MQQISRTKSNTMIKCLKHPKPQGGQWPHDKGLILQLLVDKQSFQAVYQSVLDLFFFVGWLDHPDTVP